MRAVHRPGILACAAGLVALAACAPDAPPRAPVVEVTRPAPPLAPPGDAPAAAPTSPTATAAKPVAPAEVAEPAPAAAKSPPEPPPIPPSTAVLHVGDSMVPSLARALRPHFKALGVRYEMRFEQSTFTSTWAGRMDGLVAATQPHLVIITLGGNEIGNVQPEAHARFVRRIVAATRGRPCVWTTPPLWRGETGIFDVIQKNAAPCRFFETDRFLTAPIERVGDKIHPTPRGGEAWGAVFWPWLMAERVGGEQPWALRPGSEDEYAPRGLRSAPTFPAASAPPALAP
jgi:hypothetical protein